MDTICTRCGEPWDIDTLIEDRGLPKEEQEFRTKALSEIVRCPACLKKPDTDKSIQQFQKSPAYYGVVALAELMGDDIDGFAAYLEDLDFL